MHPHGSFMRGNPAFAPTSAGAAACEAADEDYLLLGQGQRQCLPFMNHIRAQFPPVTCTRTIRILHSALWDNSVNIYAALFCMRISLSNDINEKFSLA